MSLRKAAVLAAFLVANGLAGTAWAEDAESLYQEGTALLRDKRVDAACVAFEKSERLDPRGGTLLSLAYCHEQQSKLALAYSEYDEALRRLRTGGGRPDRETFASERMTAIKDKLVFVTVELAPAVNAPSPELVLTPSRPNDNERKNLFGADRQRQVALDPDGGAYKIEVRAADRKPFTAQVQVTGKTVTPAVITVNELASENVPVAAGGGAAPVPAEADGSGQRTLGLIIGGAGVVFVGVGAFFGVKALQCVTDYNRDPTSCDRDKAMTETANFANVGVGLGVVGLVAGGYLFFTAPKGSPERSVGVRPAVGPNTAGLSLTGHF